MDKIKIYKKAFVNYEQILAESKKRLREIEREQEEKKKKVRSITVRKVIKALSFCFIGLGTVILIYSFYPYIFHFLNKVILFGPKSKEVVSLGNDPSVLSVQSRYSPQYFSNVDKNIAIISKELENNLSDYSNLQGFFYLSIPKLGFEKLPVQLNVESYDKASYEKVLKNYLAHFKGSSIPDKPGTTFVYGHSSPEWYAKINPKSVTTAFTFLPKLTIGDSISVEYNGHTYNYTVVKIKEVDPYDLSPVFQNDGRKLLALMTCIPVGIGTDRLIVVAEQI